MARKLTAQILNTGGDKAVGWLFENYSLSQIKETVREPKRGVWFDESLNYWSKFLDVNVNSNLRNRALFNLNPFENSHV